MIKVSCAIIRKGDKVLACRRKTDQIRGGKWEFPGGKMHPGEMPAECIRRELMEELSVSIKTEEILGTVSHRYPDISIELTAVRCHLVNESFHLTDHDEINWIPITELTDHDFSEADRRLIEKLWML